MRTPRLWAAGNNLWQYRDGSLNNMVDRLRNFPDFRRRRMPIAISEDDGLCAHDGTMQASATECRLVDTMANAHHTDGHACPQ